MIIRKTIRKYSILSATVWCLCFLMAVPPALFAGLPAQSTGAAVENPSQTEQETDWGKTLYFPNPGLEGQTGKITLTNLESENTAIEIRVYNMEGDLLDETRLTIEADDSESVDIETLPKGIASIMVRSETTVTGFIALDREDGGSMEIPATVNTVKQMDFPKPGCDCGPPSISVLNPNDVKANLYIICLDTEGNELRRDFLRSLMPMESEMFSPDESFEFYESEDISVARLESDIGFIISQSADQSMDVSDLIARKTTRSGRVTNQVLGFRHPVENPTPPPNNCYVDSGGCAGSLTNRHVARDYNVGLNRTTPAYSVNYGRLLPGLDWGPNSHNMGNVVNIEYVLTTGEKWMSLFAHLDSKNLGGINVNDRIAKKQKIGIVGCSGTDLTTYCNAPYSTSGANRHIHFELKKPGMGYTDTFPFGYMDQGEANQLATAFNLGQNLTISQVIDRLFSDISTFQSQNKRVLLPYFLYPRDPNSNTRLSPSSGNYDVFGIANRRLYATLPLQPSQQTTFTNVGVGGVQYGSNTVMNPFIHNRAVLSSTSLALTDQNATSSRTTFPENDYSFYAYSSEFNRGYELKFSVLPDGSEIIDNDQMQCDLSGDSSRYVAGTYAAYEGNNPEDGSSDDALEVPGYYLSAKLFKSGSAS